MACRIARTSEWTTRILHELQDKDGCFITLTYDEKNLPANGTLVKSDLQKFFKRLRKKIEPIRIKYFGCGEYGEHTKRPHYHAIIINWKPNSEDCYRPNRKSSASKTIEQLWTYGNNTVGSPDREAIQYVVGYIRKKLLGVRENEYSGIIPPFQLQSQGIGKDFAVQHKESILSDRGLTRNGIQVGLPRYYRKKLIDKDSIEEYYYHKRCRERSEAIKSDYFTLNDQYEDLGTNEANKEFIKKYQNFIEDRLSDQRRRSNDLEAKEKLIKKGTF